MLVTLCRSVGMALVISALGAGALLAGCRRGDEFPEDLQRRLAGDVGDRRTDARRQQRGQLDVPAMGDDGAPLALTGDERQVTYSGTLLFWNAEGVSPAQIAAISESSVAGRHKKSEWLDAAVATVPPLRAEVAARAAAIAANDAAIDLARRDANPEHVRAAMQEFVDGWFEGRLALAQQAGALDRVARREIERQFARYCEYKLWELATSPLVLQPFKHRPSPLSLCEPYYAERGYFTVSDDARECAVRDGGGAAASDWFDCVWKQGVLKSAMLTTLAAHAPQGDDCATSGARRADAIAAWLVPEDDGASLLRKMVQDAGRFQNKALAQMLVMEGFPSLKILLTAAAGRTFRAQFPYAVRFADCPQAFAVKGQRGADPVADELKLNAAGSGSAAPVTLAELKTIGENLSISQSEESMLPALPGREAAAEQILTIVVAPLTAYSERLASGLGDDVRASYDDFALNELTTGLIPLPDTHGGLLAIEGRVASNDQSAAFADLRRVEERILRRHHAELLAAKARLPAELTEAQAALAVGLETIAPKLRAVEDEQVTGAKAVADAGAALYFNQMRLDLTTTGGVLAVALRIGEGTFFRGCSDFSQLTACEPSGLPLDGAPATPFQAISFDGDSGKLSLVAALSDPTVQGFAAVARGSEPGKFSELDPVGLSGMTLQLEVYANRLGEHLRFLTGKALVLGAGGEVVYEGSFSADNFPAEKSRLGL